MEALSNWAVKPLTLEELSTFPVINNALFWELEIKTGWSCLGTLARMKQLYTIRKNLRKSEKTCTKGVDMKKERAQEPQRCN